VEKDASTAASRPLSQISNTAATAGLTSGFGMGPGRTLPLWPAYLKICQRANLMLLASIETDIRGFNNFFLKNIVYEYDK
jgi:hypothetical protein